MERERRGGRTDIHTDRQTDRQTDAHFCFVKQHVRESSEVQQTHWPVGLVLVLISVGRRWVSDNVPHR